MATPKSSQQKVTPPEPNKQRELVNKPISIPVIREHRAKEVEKRQSGSQTNIAMHNMTRINKLPSKRDIESPELTPLIREIKESKMDMGTVGKVRASPIEPVPLKMDMKRPDETAEHSRSKSKTNIAREASTPRPEQGRAKISKRGITTNRVQELSEKTTRRSDINDSKMDARTAGTFTTSPVTRI